MVNEISVKLSLQLFISKITTSFDDNFDPLSINIRIEAAKFKPGPTFKSTSNEIKDDHLKIIASTDMNLSCITVF